MVVVVIEVQQGSVFGFSCFEPVDTFLWNFWNSKAEYLWRDHPNQGYLADYWNFAEGFDAVVDGLNVQQLGLCGGSHIILPHDYQTYLSEMYSTQSMMGWNGYYIDDMNWMGMSLSHAYDLIGEPLYLQSAKTIWDQISRQWDTTCCGTRLGGIWWDMGHTSKVTASNAGPALFSAMLYMQTHNIEYLNFATKVYNFWWNNMVNYTSGQVADSFHVDGSVYWWKYTYNEGLMIGASVKLYDITKNTTYLDNAHKMASFVLSSETTESNVGRVLYDGAACSGTNCPLFKGVAFRHLTALNSRSPRREYSTLLDACAQSVALNDKQKSTGLYGTFWEGPAPQDTDSINIAQEASAVMALAVHHANSTGQKPRRH